MERSRQVLAVPRWVMVLGVATVGAVAAVASAVSYSHEIVTVLGMLVASSMMLLIRRLADTPTGWLPWVGQALGVGGRWSRTSGWPSRTSRPRSWRGGRRSRSSWCTS